MKFGGAYLTETVNYRGAVTIFLWGHMSIFICRHTNVIVPF